MPETPEGAPSPSILTRGDGATIAYHKIEGNGPGVVFLGGFKSDMTGTKARTLENHCWSQGRAFLRFDYFGHGQSSGAFADGTIGRWSEDALAVLDDLTQGPQVLVGSSMGGWLMVLVALARPGSVAGLLGIAAAPDFTEVLMWQRFSDEVKTELEQTGVHYQPSDYDDGPYAITMALIEDGRHHQVLERPIAVHCPVRLIHGMKDDAVPWEHAARLSEALLSDHVTLALVKNGDHRLSREQDLDRMCHTLERLCEEVG